MYVCIYIYICIYIYVYMYVCILGRFAASCDIARSRQCRRLVPYDRAILRIMIPFLPIVGIYVCICIFIHMSIG